MCNACKNNNGNGHCVKFKKNYYKALIICRLGYFEDDNLLGEVLKSKTK